MRTLKIGMCIMIAAIAVGCGASASDLAKKDAQSMAYQLANTKMTGDEAQAKLQNIKNLLEKNNLDFTNIGRSYTELRAKVRVDYADDVQTATGQLMATHANPEQAEKLRKEIIRLSSNAAPASNVSTAELDRQVALNGLEFAQRNTKKVTPAMYVAAGLPVPRITKTRTIVKRVPVRVAPAKKKPTPRRHTARR